MHEVDKVKTAQFINELFLEIKARCPAWPQSWPNPEIEKKISSGLDARNY